MAALLKNRLASLSTSFVLFLIALPLIRSERPGVHMSFGGWTRRALHRRPHSARVSAASRTQATACFNARQRRCDVN